MSKLTPKDVEDFSALLGEIQDRSKEAGDLTSSLLEKVKSDDFQTESGLSFLELKNHMLLDYITNLAYVMLRKCSGKGIAGQPAIERIAEDRTVLEKLRPIEKKLKIQIDKAVKVAESGTLQADDPLNFKPNLGALNVADDNDNSTDEENVESDSAEIKTKNKKQDGKYVAPKNVPTYYEDNDREAIAREEANKAKKKTLSKSIMEDLKRQHLDLPEEEFNHVDTMKAAHIAKMKERIRYEEENFTRLPVTKKDKHKRRRQMTTMGTLGDEMTYFGNSNFYNDSAKGSKKRKSGSHSKSKGAARKKFKKR